MCETIVFDRDLQNPNEVDNASDDASISDINWQMQALHLSDDNGNLNQGYNITTMTTTGMASVTIIHSHRQAPQHSTCLHFHP
jgi:hypothetical protein